MSSALRSEFITVTSTSTTDYQVVDLSGAVESVFGVRFGSESGFLTNEPYATSPRLSLQTTMTNPIVTRSNDDRLFWVSAGAADAVLEVWIIRRG